MNEIVENEKLYSNIKKILALLLDKVIVDKEGNFEIYFNI